MANIEKAQSLARYFLEARASPTYSSPSLMSQTAHRLSLVSYWVIESGSRILEIGCGQGDCTIVLADAVGEKGFVDALDPGAPDYGAPFTLSQSQSFISSTPLGPRIAFHNTTPEAYLETYTGPAYDYIILSHCIWYFESPSLLSSIVSLLPRRTKFLCIAEWSLRSTTSATYPHVLASLLLGILESKRKVPGSGNVRSVLSPRVIGDEVRKAGFEVEKEEVRGVNEGLQDGLWEVGFVLRNREKLVRESGANGVGEKEMGPIVAMFDALQQSVGTLAKGIESVKSMDVWVAKFRSLE
ncbi:hypothetical protein B7494_g3064 [Chlorociboria aeruginascens]|nr:hypothetical protein B7494_g3064 [Chlorociboria aeruginascens]